MRSRDHGQSTGISAWAFLAVCAAVIACILGYLWFGTNIDSSSSEADPTVEQLEREKAFEEKSRICEQSYSSILDMIRCENQARNAIFGKDRDSAIVHPIFQRLDENNDNNAVDLPSPSYDSFATPDRSGPQISQSFSFRDLYECADDYASYGVGGYGCMDPLVDRCVSQLVGSRFMDPFACSELGMSSLQLKRCVQAGYYGQIRDPILCSD